MSVDNPDWMEKLFSGFRRKGRAGVDVSNIALSKLHEAGQNGVEIILTSDDRTASGTPKAEVNKVVVKENIEKENIKK